MPEKHVTINGVRYNYEERGSGNEVIFFGHGLMYNWRSFAHQLAHFANHDYRCIAIDWRGQGGSEGGGDADDYSLYRLGDDAAALLEALSIESCHWVGVSMGAMVAMRLYPRQPDLFRSLVLIDTSAADAPDLLPAYSQMATTFREHGPVPPLLEALDRVFYTADFPQQNPEAVKAWHSYWQQADRETMYKAVMPVINRDDVSETMDQISVPTLIIVGDQDNATPPAKAADLHRRIAGSQLVTIPDSGHMAVIEQDNLVTEAIDTFLKSL